jgi:hypothetical protein
MNRFNLPLVLLLLLAACGGSSSSTANNEGIDAGDVIDCSTDSRVFSYKAGMSVKSANGQLSYELVQSNPGPPAKGNDVWNLMVTDTATGAPQPSLSLSVLPFMPDHGHGSSVDAQITNGGAGNYTVTPLYFFMPGVWRITFTNNANSDTAIFFFCVPG